MKFLSNLRLATTALLACTTASLAAPASAEDNLPVVSVRAGTAISAVFDNTEIAMAPLPGGRANIGFEADPAFFQGASLCLAGLDDNWPIKRDGTLHVEMATIRSDGTVEPARRSAREPVCAVIGNDGRAAVANPFGPTAVPFILRDGRIIAWAGRNRLDGLAL